MYPFLRLCIQTTSSFQASCISFLIICNFIIQSIMQINFLSETSSLKLRRGAISRWPLTLLLGSYRGNKFTGNKAVVVWNFWKDGRFEACVLLEKQVYVLIWTANSGLKKKLKVKSESNSTRTRLWQPQWKFNDHRIKVNQENALNLFLTLFLIFLNSGLLEISRD